MTTTTTPSGDLRRAGLRTLGGAPSVRSIVLARLWFIIAATVTGPAVLCLVWLLGVRIATLAMPVGLGPVFAIVMGVLIALGALGIVSYIAFKHSRGTVLGRTLAASGKELEKVHLDVDALEEDVASALREGHALLAEADGTIAQADDQATREVEQAMVGIKIGALVLGVDTVVTPDRSRIVTPSQPHREHFAGKMLTARSDARILGRRLHEGTLPVLQAAPDPHAGVHRPHEGNVDVEYLDPSAQPGLTSVKTAEEGRPRRWPLIVGVVALAALLLGAGIAFASGAFAATDVPSASAPATPGESAAPGGTTDGTTAVEGVDYAFFSGTGTQPASWSCSAQITVALAGGFPEGAEETVTTAVAAVAEASDLPLQVIEPGSSASITVSYRPSAYIAKLGGSDSAIGVAKPMILAGTIVSATVALAEESPSNAPDSPSAALVLEHELAHAVGLAHVTQTGELMQPELDDSLVGFGNGDRRGLQLVGC